MITGVSFAKNPDRTIICGEPLARKVFWNVPIKGSPPMSDDGITNCWSECPKCKERHDDTLLCETPRPEPSPCKHYFTGGGLIKVCCMKCNELESRSIYYPDETYTRQQETIEELQETLDNVLCYFDEAKDDCAICNKGIFAGHTDGCIIPEVQKALARSREMLGEGK